MISHNYSYVCDIHKVMIVVAINNEPLVLVKILTDHVLNPNLRYIVYFIAIISGNYTIV